MVNDCVIANICVVFSINSTNSDGIYDINFNQE